MDMFFQVTHVSLGNHRVQVYHSWTLPANKCCTRVDPVVYHCDFIGEQQKINTHMDKKTQMIMKNDGFLRPTPCMPCRTMRTT